MSNKFDKKKKLEKSPIPVYFQLQNELKQYIENGEWGPGELIPSSRNIAETYDVSMGTVQKAIANLEKEKYLYCVQGKGTFVSTTGIKQESLRYTLLRDSFKGEDLHFKVKHLGSSKIKGIEPVNQYLNLSKVESLYVVKRVFMYQNKPMVYNVSYLPSKLFHDFEEKVIKSIDRMTMYEVIEEKYGLPTLRNEELFDITEADEEVAHVLNVEKGKSLLTTEMLAYTYKDQPYEYRVSYWITNNRKLFREMH